MAGGGRHFPKNLEDVSPTGCSLRIWLYSPVGSLAPWCTSGLWNVPWETWDGPRPRWADGDGRRPSWRSYVSQWWDWDRNPIETENSLLPVMLKGEEMQRRTAGLGQCRMLLCQQQSMRKGVGRHPPLPLNFTEEKMYGTIRNIVETLGEEEVKHCTS